MYLFLLVLTQNGIMEYGVCNMETFVDTDKMVNWNCCQLPNQDPDLRCHTSEGTMFAPEK